MLTNHGVLELILGTATVAIGLAWQAIHRTTKR